MLADVDFGVCSETCDCISDLDLNGRVDGGDMGLMLGAWGGPGGDVNNDGVTNGADLGMLLGEWGSCGPDCDADGVSDYDAIEAGAADCNLDGIPDDCQEQVDCDGDGIWDACAIAAGEVEDCNTNLIPDSCEIADGSGDEDGNGVLDECQLDGFTYAWTVTGDWGTGFTADLTINNDSGQCLSGWEALFARRDLHGGFGLERKAGAARGRSGPNRERDVERRRLPGPVVHDRDAVLRITQPTRGSDAQWKPRGTGSLIHLPAFDPPDDHKPRYRLAPTRGEAVPCVDAPPLQSAGGDDVRPSVQRHRHRVRPERASGPHHRDQVVRMDGLFRRRGVRRDPPPADALSVEATARGPLISSRPEPGPDDIRSSRG